MRKFPFTTLQFLMVIILDQGSIYGRRDHNQAEVDHNQSGPEVLNFYVQKSKVLSFMYNRAFLLWLSS